MTSTADHARSRVGRHHAVFVAPPVRVPSDKQVDGPLLGNGDVGVVCCGPAEHLRFLIAKSDFWKSKPGYPNGGPRPVGGIDLIAPALQGASYRVEVDLLRGELTGRFAGNGVEVALCAWVSATQNLLLIEVAVLTGSVALEPLLWVATGDDAIAHAQPEAQPATIRRRYDEPGLAWPCEVAVALGNLERGATRVTLQAGQRGRWVAALCSGFEDAAPTAAATRRVAALDATQWEALQVAHRRWWADFWAESYVEIHDDLIERHYYGAQYLLACCCRNPDFPPGLWGNWITTDTPAWAGDYHLNYNYQAPFWGLYSSNHLRLAECYDAPLLHYIPAARRNAAQFLGVRGIYCEVGIGPHGFCSSLFRTNEQAPGTIRAAELDHGHQFWGQKSNALFGAVPMILRWHHERKRDYARRVHPYLIEVAHFWEDYLKFEDGRYVIHQDAYSEAGPWEGAGWEAQREDVNPLISLGLLRLFFPAMIEIDTVLGGDARQCAKWRHFLDHLSPLPLAERDGRLLPQAAEGGPSRNKIGANRLTFHGTVWPASVVGQDLMPEYFLILREAATAWGEEVWVRDGNAFDTVPPGAARLRIDPEHILAMLRAKIHAHALPNLLIVQGGGGIETCGGITAGINEMLLQSYEGVLRLFPCWPAERDARFANLRAWGAFLVSAELAQGVVQGVELLSEQGGDCRLMNPWPGQPVRLTRNGRPAEVLQGERLAFTTAPGEVLAMGRHPAVR